MVRVVGVVRVVRVVRVRAVWVVVMACGSAPRPAPPVVELPQRPITTGTGTGTGASTSAGTGSGAGDHCLTTRVRALLACRLECHFDYRLPIGIGAHVQEDADGISCLERGDRAHRRILPLPDA